MAMKMIEKMNCTYKGGYIVNNDEIVCIDNEIVDLLNKLEDDLQRKQFEDTSTPQFVAPAGKFRRKTEHGEIYPHVVADTPELDVAVERSMRLMEEMDQMNNADKINDYFKNLGPVILFVNQDFIVSGEQATQHQFDLPTIGNPLMLDKEELSELVISLFD